MMTQPPTPKSDDNDRRHYFRLDDHVILTYRQVSQEELLEVLSMLEESLGDSFTLATAFADISQTTRPLNRQIRLEFPAIANYFDALERKLDLLAQALVRRELEVEEKSASEVNLSAGGMEFRSDEPIPVGSMLEMRFMVLPSRMGIMAGGKVVRCEPVQSDHGGYRVAAEFAFLRESDRQSIIRHLLGKQSLQLRQRRGNAD